MVFTKNYRKKRGFSARIISDLPEFISNALPAPSSPTPGATINRAKNDEFYVAGCAVNLFTCPKTK